MSRNTCRLCLSTEGTMEDIFSPSDSGMPQKIFQCINIEIKYIEGLPHHLCEVCKSEIVMWSRFKKQCMKANDFLQNQYPNLFYDEGDKGAIKTNTQDRDYHERQEIEFIVDTSADETTRDEGADIDVVDVHVEVVDSCDSLSDGGNIESTEVMSETSSKSIDPIDDSSKEEDIKKMPQGSKYKVPEVWKTRSGKRIRYYTRCVQCGKFQQNIKQHMLIHSNEMPFHCPYCGRGFRQRSNFKHHVNIHTGEKPYKCKECEKAFSDPASLRSHMIQHTGERRYSCEICGKAFGYSHTLTAHRRIHTQDRRHFCDYCPKKFLSKHALSKHIRTHTGERPYQCDKCPKRFSTSGNLSTHKKVHTKERPYTCNICQHSFSYRSVLNSHMKIHTRKAVNKEDEEIVYRVIEEIDADFE